MATDTSSAAAGSSCVVDGAAAAPAALIVDPIAFKSVDAAAKASGPAITNEDIDVSLALCERQYPRGRLLIHRFGKNFAIYPDFTGYSFLNVSNEPAWAWRARAHMCTPRCGISCAPG